MKKGRREKGLYMMGENPSDEMTVLDITFLCRLTFYRARRFSPANIEKSLLWPLRRGDNRPYTPFEVYASNRARSLSGLPCRIGLSGLPCRIGLSGLPSGRCLCSSQGCAGLVAREIDGGRIVARRSCLMVVEVAGVDGSSGIASGLVGGRGRVELARGGRICGRT
ncbi:hypothetical protein AKJ16_DCAP20177, partial [Drosera capensis]